MSTGLESLTRVGGAGGVGAGVVSVFGRTGAVVAQTNDYTWAQINKATSSLADLTTRDAGDLNSGTLLAARMPALTGDVTSSAGSVSTTIANNAVTLAKLADIATTSFMGRNTAGTGDPEVLSVATAKTMLGLTGTNSGDVTLAGENYLSIAGQVITANAINLSGTHVTSTLPVTKGGTGTSTAFTPGSVVFAGASGVYAQDNTNLFWDDSANRLGIGLATPSQLLHINGASPSIRVQDTSASNIGELTLVADFFGIGVNRVNATGAIFNSGKTAASIFMFAGNANSGITFATSPTNNTDGTQRMKIDKDGKVKIGTGDPTQLLEVTGNTFINAATANLFLKDISTGWQVAATTVITPQTSNSIRSTSFTSGLVGWNISALGNAEFNNIDVRGALHSSIFTFNSIQATAGTLGVFKTSVKLRNDVVIPSSPVYGTDSVNVDVEDHDGLHVQQFAGNDIIRLKGLVSGGVGDTWLKVSSFVDNGTWWRYGCIIMAGSNNVTYRAGMGVPDYGLNGQGFIIQTADQTNAPYLQMATHSASFTSNDASGTLVVTPQLRIGNLNGSYGLATDTFGFAAGQYGVAGKSWIIVDPTNGVRIGNNTTTLTQIDASGNASFSGSITSTSGTIAGWTIASNRITSGSTTIASGFDAPAGAMAWFGQSATGYRGMAIRDSSNREIDIISNNSTIWPYLAVNDGTRFRVVLGGLNNAWGSDGSTSSMGMKIWSSAGTKLVEFSDSQNMIANWAIASTSLSNGNVTIGAGVDPSFVNGTAAAYFGKFSTNIFGMFLKPTSGTDSNLGIACNTNIGTAMRPYFFIYDGTRFRIVIGELNTTAWDGAATNSLGFKIWNSSGNLLVHFSDVQNTIAGWTIATTKISSTGIDINSGASAGLAFGSTPPTSASAGTGIWLDRTGLYGLLSNTVQAKFDAATGKISAGAGEVTLDADGINFNNGTATANRIKWFDGSRVLGDTWTGKSAGTGTFYNIQAHSVGTGSTSNDLITSLSLAADNSNTNGGGIANIDINVHGPAHATRPNQQVIYATWFDSGGSPTRTGGLIVGPNLGFTSGLTASAALEVRTTTGAFMLAPITTTQRDALTPSNGMLVYNSTAGKFQGRAGGAWVDLH